MQEDPMRTAQLAEEAALARRMDSPVLVQQLVAELVVRQAVAQRRQVLRQAQDSR
jgi:hypothetical protein